PTRWLAIDSPEGRRCGRRSRRGAGPYRGERGAGVVVRAACRRAAADAPAGRDPEWIGGGELSLGPLGDAGDVSPSGDDGEGAAGKGHLPDRGAAGGHSVEAGARG